MPASTPLRQALQATKRRLGPPGRPSAGRAGAVSSSLRADSGLWNTKATWLSVLSWAFKSPPPRSLCRSGEYGGRQGARETICGSPRGAHTGSGARVSVVEPRVHVESCPGSSSRDTPGRGTRRSRGGHLRRHRTAARASAARATSRGSAGASVGGRKARPRVFLVLGLIEHRDGEVFHADAAVSV